MFTTAGNVVCAVLCQLVISNFAWDYLTFFYFVCLHILFVWVYLVEEVLDQLSNSDVVVVPVNQQHLLQVFELGNCIVAVTGRLTPLFTHDP